MSFNPNSFSNNQEGPGGELTASTSRLTLWSKILQRVRNEAITAIQLGETFGTVAGLICLAGLTYWCPMCGGWHGNGPPPGPEPAPAPPVPDVLKKIVAAEIDIPSRTESRRSVEEGFIDGQPAKIRREGNRIEAFWGGEGKPDDLHHGHIVSHDGQNANYVREPGPERDRPVNDHWPDPYSPPTQDSAGRYEFE